MIEMYRINFFARLDFRWWANKEQRERESEKITNDWDLEWRSNGGVRHRATVKRFCHSMNGAGDEACLFARLHVKRITISRWWKFTAEFIDKYNRLIKHSFFLPYFFVFCVDASCFVWENDFWLWPFNAQWNRSISNEPSLYIIIMLS